MPRAPRAQKFLIDPLSVTRDPDRMAMSKAAQGVYDTLWLESWLAKEPGFLPADDRLLACLGQCSSEEWAMVREEVLRAFEFRPDPGGVTARDCHVCRSVTRSKASQDSMRDKWRERQRRKRLRERDSGVTSPVGSGSGSGSVTIKKDSLVDPSIMGREKPVAQRPVSSPRQPLPKGPVQVGEIIRRLADR